MINFTALVKVKNKIQWLQQVQTYKHLVHAHKYSQHSWIIWPVW